jgi:hypothetical protein
MLHVHQYIDVVCNPVKYVVVLGLLVMVVFQEGSWQEVPRVGGRNGIGGLVRRNHMIHAKQDCLSQGKLAHLESSQSSVQGLNKLAGDKYTITLVL